MFRKNPSIEVFEPGPGQRFATVEIQFRIFWKNDSFPGRPKRVSMILWGKDGKRNRDDFLLGLGNMQVTSDREEYTVTKFVDPKELDENKSGGPDKIYAELTLETEGSRNGRMAWLEQESTKTNVFKYRGSTKAAFGNRALIENDSVIFIVGNRFDGVSDQFYPIFIIVPINWSASDQLNATQSRIVWHLIGQDKGVRGGDDRLILPRTANLGITQPPVFIITDDISRRVMNEDEGKWGSRDEVLAKVQLQQLHNDLWVDIGEEVKSNLVSRHF